MFKRFVIIGPLLFMILMANTMAQASWTNIKGQLSNLKWPKDRVEDQVNLLPFAQEFRLNHFLQKINDQEQIQVLFYFIPSLEGADLDETARKALNDRLTPSDGSEASGLLFLLSLSDRQFKIETTGEMRDKISPQELAYLVNAAIPSLSQQKYSQAIESFLNNLLFKVKGSHTYKVPQLNLKKSYNLNSLLFFLVGGIIVFILGHKVRKTPKILAKDPGLVRKKTQETAIFW